MSPTENAEAALQALSKWEEAIAKDGFTPQLIEEGKRILTRLVVVHATLPEVLIKYRTSVNTVTNAIMAKGDHMDGDKWKSKYIMDAMIQKGLASGVSDAYQKAYNYQEVLPVVIHTMRALLGL